MDRYLLAAFVISILAGCLAIALAAQARLELTKILIPERAWLNDLTILALALIVVSVTHVIIYTLIDQKTVRLALALIMIVMFSTTQLFGGTLFATFVLLSAALGLLVAQIREYKGIGGLWSFLGKVRGLSAFIIFILVLLVAYSNPQPFQESFKRTLITFALSQAAPGANLGDAIDKMIPDTVDENELQHLREALRTEYPNFDALPPEVQKQLEKNMIESYIRIKQQIKAALREAFSKVDPETLAQQLEKSIQSMPLFQKIMEYASVLYALAASFIYTLLSWLASIFAFLLGILLWRGRRSEKVDKELADY